MIVSRSKRKPLILSIIFFVLAFNICCKAEFSITVNIKNCKPTLKAFLTHSVDGLNIKGIIDSASLTNSQFHFKGKNAKTELINIFLLDNANQHLTTQTPVICFFIENSSIDINVDADKIPTYANYGAYPYNSVNVTGSFSQNLLKEFFDHKSLSQKAYALLLESYLKHLKTIDNHPQESVSKGIKLIEPLDSMKTSSTNYTIDFIKKHSDNAVALFIAEKYLDRFSKNEIQNIYQILYKHNKNKIEFASFSKKIDYYNKSNLGSHFLDYTVLDTSGKSVKLSDYISGKNKYVLLEFWASWCTPCRKDFPHLKTAYELYRSSGFEIIGISIDENITKWKKAIQDDRLPWLQFKNPEGPIGGLLSLYNFNDVPTSILISPEGIIVNRNMRESWLDKDLLSIFGNKFSDLY